MFKGTLGVVLAALILTVGAVVVIVIFMVAVLPLLGAVVGAFSTW